MRPSQSSLPTMCMCLLMGGNVSSADEDGQEEEEGGDDVSSQYNKAIMPGQCGLGPLSVKSWLCGISVGLVSTLLYSNSFSCQQSCEDSKFYSTMRYRTMRHLRWSSSVKTTVGCRNV